jgi:hypothetical protein
MINNPVGIGVFLSILTVIALIFILLRLKDLFKKENHWLGITLAWFILTFYAVNAVNMPIKISPFRAWMLLVIPVSILAAEGTFFLMNSLKKFGIGKAIVLSLIIIGVLSTSAYQKYTVNTAQWPPGAFWTSNEEIVGYLWIKDNLPLDTKVFTFVNDAPIIAYDKFTCHWCEDIHDFQKTGFNESAEKTYNWLKSKNYDYIVVDGQTSRKFGANETNNKIQSFINSNQFRHVFNNNGLIIFGIA